MLVNMLPRINCWIFVVSWVFLGFVNLANAQIQITSVTPPALSTDADNVVTIQGQNLQQVRDVLASFSAKITVLEKPASGRLLKVRITDISANESGINTLRLVGAEAVSGFFPIAVDAIPTIERILKFLHYLAFHFVHYALNRFRS